jgi:hypothetical protein
MLKDGRCISNLSDGEAASSRALTSIQRLKLLSALERELTSYLESKLQTKPAETTYECDSFVGNFEPREHQSQFFLFRQRKTGCVEGFREPFVSSW